MLLDIVKNSGVLRARGASAAVARSQQQQARASQRTAGLGPGSAFSGASLLALLHCLCQSYHSGLNMLEGRFRRAAFSPGPTCELAPTALG